VFGRSPGPPPFAFGYGWQATRRRRVAPEAPKERRETGAAICTILCSARARKQFRRTFSRAMAQSLNREIPAICAHVLCLFSPSPQWLHLRGIDGRPPTQGCGALGRRRQILAAISSCCLDLLCRRSRPAHSVNFGTVLQIGLGKKHSLQNDFGRQVTDPPDNSSVRFTSRFSCRISRAS
jgi:hypothetical protein